MIKLDNLFWELALTDISQSALW